MKIKKNDLVKIRQGKDKGKTGKVLKVFRDDNKVVVEGINLLVKHTRPKKEREKGQRIQFPAPLNVSKVILVCPHCGKTTRVGFKTILRENNKKMKMRFCRKCQEVIG